MLPIMVNIAPVMTVCSALALGLVMFLHVPLPPAHWIFNIGVPWFFFASGYWYAQSDGSYVENITHRIYSLLIPYFLWNLLWFPILFICNWLGWRFCGAERVIDGSLPCVLRCIGLSPFAWPALVPTWFLRALFVAVAVVGALDHFLGKRRLLVCGICWVIYATAIFWGPHHELWRAFIAFGFPIFGCACFGTGLALGNYIHPIPAKRAPNWVNRIRHQMMPTYLLHAVIIVSIGWIAKALHCFDHLRTIPCAIALWTIGILGSFTLGSAIRKFAPRAARFLFGGR